MQYRPSSCEQQSNNLDEYSDDSDAESDKVRKAKKYICNLIDGYEARPCLWYIFCDDYHNRDVTGIKLSNLMSGKELLLYRK